MEKTNKREQALFNFKKAKSHLEKVIKMTEEGKYCVEVMQQNLAVIGLLKSSHQMLMENHLHSCFISAMSSGNQAKKNQMVEEILKVSKLVSR